MTEDSEKTEIEKSPPSLSLVGRIREHRNLLLLPISIVIVFAIVMAIYTLTGRSDPGSTSSSAMEPSRGEQAMDTVSESGVEMLELPSYEAPGGLYRIQREIDVHTIFPDRPRMEVVKYQVQQGDTLFDIADRFSLKPETVLWGNWVVLDQDPHTLQPGQELDIPPVDGVLYTWDTDDRLEAVADFFHVDPEEIIDWPGNQIAPDVDSSDVEIREGALIVVPGGRRDPPSWQMVSITRGNPAAASILGPGFCGAVYTGPIGSGVFDWPTSSTWVSGYYFVPGVHEAIDIGGSVGNAIYAADDGVVVYSGWNNYGYGNVIVVDHGNGWQTLYAHLDRINFGCGQGVFKGTKIGTMGLTGKTSGPHLHFEMRSDIWGRVNPANFLP